MPFCNSLENAILAQIFGGVTIPSSLLPTVTSGRYNIGLIAAQTWYPGWTVSAGAYCVANPNTTPWLSSNLGWTSLPSSSIGKIFICTTGGTTNSVGQGQPTWQTTTGATTTETNGVVWAEVSSSTYFGGGVFTGAAPTGGNYVVQPVVQTVAASGFTSAATVSSIGQVQNGATAITFPATTSGAPAYTPTQQVGFTLFDNTNSGYRFWGLLSTCFLVANSGLTPSIASGALTINLT